MTIIFNNARGEQVGILFDGIYKTKRNNMLGQIFRSPKYQNGLAVDVAILEELKKKECKYIHMTIEKFEEKPFLLKISLDKFMENSQEVCFDKKGAGSTTTGYGKQRVCPMKYFEYEELK